MGNREVSYTDPSRKIHEARVKSSGMLTVLSAAQAYCMSHPHVDLRTFTCCSSMVRVILSGTIASVFMGLVSIPPARRTVQMPLKHESFGLASFSLTQLSNDSQTGASIGALIWDTATIPFVLSACSGFVLGAVGFYRDAVRKSLRSLDRYPRLLQLHLDANFPHRGFDTWPSTRFRSAYFGSTWILRSMLVASWLTATNAIDVSNSVLVLCGSIECSHGFR